MLVTPETMLDLATKATDPDQKISKPAIEKLRDAGPAGLDALVAANKIEITNHLNPTKFTGPKPIDTVWPRLTAALDAVAMQRNAYSSGLYWYTDLTAAKAAAHASGKPILSLRLLGNLNDEYSCANSRFFRTVLYANAEVSNHLREHFILHWQSVRPVPVITIDFGDGRVIHRTITGSSIHYVLTSDGKVVDGIPGLYGPKAFLRELEEAETEVAALSNAKDEATSLIQWHAARASSIDQLYQEDLKRINSAQTLSATWSLKNADAIYSISADSKGIVEKGFAVGLRTEPTPSPAVLAATAEGAEWKKIAALHADAAALDSASRRLISTKIPDEPDATTAARRAISKFAVETPLLRTIRNFQSSIAQDTVRNQYLFHAQIHRWLANPKQTASTNDLATLNKRIYAELFLTPDSDPWLGLVPPDTYTALDDDGMSNGDSPRN